VTSRRC